MKKLISLLLTSVIVFNVMAKGGEKEVKIKTSAVCEMCKERIEKNLSLSKGVKEAVLDLDTKIVTIKYNAKKTDEAKLKKIIINTGYDADDVLANDKAHDNLPSCCKKGNSEHHDH